MALTKTHRIIILLVVDTVFFLLELIAGYTVHSLALIADSFHMLNDVLSLLVGLWAVKVANREPNSKMYTYGWQRAETLGALVNGVFLIALCVSIFLEAIQRIVEPQTVNNPRFVCIVGCLGLLSNILGLVLFHDHSHGHGHSHGDGHERKSVHSVDDAAEQGLAKPHDQETDQLAKQQAGYTNGSTTEPSSPYTQRRRTIDSQSRGARRSSTMTGRNIDVGDIPYPAALRDGIIAGSRYGGAEANPDSESEQREDPSETSTLLRHKDRVANYIDEDNAPTPRVDGHADDIHRDHKHAQPKPKEHKAGGHGHDLNMRGVFLHVMGDALGNIGVIASALIIWLTDISWRYYVDPGISLVITLIILCSAIPLCKAASRILLQAVPPGMSIDHIQNDIERLDGVVGSHHLHVWQLSDTKVVASIHIQVDTDIKGEGSERYMLLARQVRQCLHAYGIHSSTIQPEFAPESDVEDNTGGQSSSRASNHEPNSGKVASGAASVREGDSQACLLECDENCVGGQCCPTKPA